MKCGEGTAEHLLVLERGTAVAAAEYHPRVVVDEPGEMSPHGGEGREAAATQGGWVKRKTT